MSVDLPSSTLPAVVKRSNSFSQSCGRSASNASFISTFTGFTRGEDNIRNSPPASSIPWSPLHRDRWRGFRARSGGRKSSPPQSWGGYRHRNELRRCTERNRASASGTSPTSAARRGEALVSSESERESRCESRLHVRGRNTAEQLECFQAGCSARHRVRSNWREGRRECSLFFQCAN